jgi:UDP-galactopyranose mutase
MNIAIVGAGLSGSIIAHELAKHQHSIDLFESRSHIGGNCYTKVEPVTGILIHEYGPHIFHTSNERVWNYISELCTMMPYTNRVKAITHGKVYSMPINLLTLNSFFNKTMSPSEARVFIGQCADLSIHEPANFEEQALKFLGKDLYEAFFKYYTQKQWGRDPKELPASILKRLPIRFDYNDNYYSSQYQGIPQEGYTHIFDQLLDHPRIHLNLSSKVKSEQLKGYDHVFVSAPIDYWYNYRFGRLSYRSLSFEREIHDGDYQGNPVINYCDNTVNWTRITEHKHFDLSNQYEKTVIFKEFSKEAGEKDTPYYPIRLDADKRVLSKYLSLANSDKHVTLIGRLGTYRYLDMHICIKEALDISASFLGL